MQYIALFFQVVCNDSSLKNNHRFKVQKGILAVILRLSVFSNFRLIPSYSNRYNGINTSWFQLHTENSRYDNPLSRYPLLVAGSKLIERNTNYNLGEDKNKVNSFVLSIISYAFLVELRGEKPAEQCISLSL